MKIKIQLKVPIKTRIARFKIRLAKKHRAYNKPIRNNARDSFYTHLINQEVRMWFNNPNMFTAEDWKYIVTRRGFNIFEQHTILLLLYSLGLPTSNIQLIDLEQYKKELLQEEFANLVVDCLAKWESTKFYEDKPVRDNSIGKIFGIMFGKFDWRN